MVCRLRRRGPRCHVGRRRGGAPSSASGLTRTYLRLAAPTIARAVNGLGWPPAAGGVHARSVLPGLVGTRGPEGLSGHTPSIGRLGLPWCETALLTRPAWTWRRNRRGAGSGIQCRCDRQPDHVRALLLLGRLAKGLVTLEIQRFPPTPIRTGGSLCPRISIRGTGHGVGSAMVLGNPRSNLPPWLGRRRVADLPIVRQAG